MRERLESFSSDIRFAARALRKAPRFSAAAIVTLVLRLDATRCETLGVRPSRGTVGDCYDNAICESFFATLECEYLNRHAFLSQAEARIPIFRFIEGWYNPHRRHSALG